MKNKKLLVDFDPNPIVDVSSIDSEIECLCKNLEFNSPDEIVVFARNNLREFRDLSNKMYRLIGDIGHEESLFLRASEWSRIIGLVIVKLGFLGNRSNLETSGINSEVVKNAVATIIVYKKVTEQTIAICQRYL